MENVLENKKKFNIKSIGLWGLQILSALLFIMAGYSKISGAEEMVKEFNVIGFGQGLRYLTGGLELIAAFLLLMPKFVSFGSLLLTFVMFGAVATHIVILQNNATFAAVILLIQIIITFAYKDQLIDIIKNLSPDKK